MKRKPTGTRAIDRWGWPAFWVLVLLALATAAARAQDAPAASKETSAQAEPKQETDTPEDTNHPTLAVLPLQTNLKEPKDAGPMLAEILATRLAVQGPWRVLDRPDLDRILDEHKLKLSGLVAPDDAARVGRLAGAQLVITGRLTRTDGSLLLICKGVSVASGELKGFFLTLSADTSFSDVAGKTADRLVRVVPGWVDQLIPPDQRGPGLADRLRAELEDRQPPIVAVIVPEHHAQGAELPDPAVQTELEHLLTAAGIRTVEVSPKVRRGVADGKIGADQLPGYLHGVTHVVLGQAVSEGGGWSRGLSVGLARVELKVVDLASRAVIVADRQTGRVADLSQTLAEKSALQKAARAVAGRLLPRWIDRLPRRDDKSGA